MSSPAVIMAIGFATVVREFIRLPRGMENCLARCQWWRERGKLRVRFWRMNRINCPRNIAVNCSSRLGAIYRLERYKLQPRGASFSADMQPLIVGGENFCPVGLGLSAGWFVVYE